VDARAARPHLVSAVEGTFRRPHTHRRAFIRFPRYSHCAQKSAPWRSLKSSDQCAASFTAPSSTPTSPESGFLDRHPPQAGEGQESRTCRPGAGSGAESVPESEISEGRNKPQALGRPWSCSVREYRTPRPRLQLGFQALTPSHPMHPMLAGGLRRGPSRSCGSVVV